MSIVRKTVIYMGTVQGVGFRYTSANIAKKHAVAGYVRNLPDGRVELVVEGYDSDISELLSEISDSMKDYIEKVLVTESAASGTFSSFKIGR